jgi:hypothetical protein
MPLAIPVADLLANDSDADIATDGQLLGVTAVAVPGGLHTVVLADGVATFTPSHNFGGTVIFTYTVSDGALAATGRVSVIVTAVNDPPVPVNQTFSGIEDSPLTLFASDFLFLSSDPDNPRSALSLTGVRATPATHGTVVLAGDRVTYTPDRDFNGQAQFEFTISDGSLTGSALATVNVEARPGAGPRRR